MEMYPLCCLYYRYVSNNRHLLLPMKLIILFITVFVLQAKSGSYAQTVNLALTNVSLETVFKEIKQQTGYRFIYTREELRMGHAVSVHVRGAELKDVLDLCFENQPLYYVLDAPYVIIRVKTVLSKESAEPASAIDVNGVVVNERGEILAGITVQIKGSRITSFTDEQGRFSFKNIAVNDVLQFSSVTTDYFEQQVSGGTMRIVLQTKIGKLDEVHVIAYGSTTQRLNTGNVSRIEQKEIDRQPVTNPLAAMQGRVAGLFVTTQNGLPGGNITVQIRGRGSINSGTEPLYVIDGVPFQSVPMNNSFGTLTTGVTGSISPLNSLNPSDIESIEILKDADATAIYGSRGANGVVLITTKKGKAGKTKVDINVSTGVNRASVLPAMQGLKDYLTMRREGFANDQVQASVQNAPDLLLWDTSKASDWVRYLLGGNASVTDARMSLSGGSAQTNFLLSGFFRKEGSILPGDLNYTKGGAHVFVQHNSSDKKFGVELSSSYSADENHTLASSVFSILTLPPNFPTYDVNGDFNWTGVSDMNPEAALLRKANYETRSLISNVVLRYTLFKGAIFKTSVGYNRTETDQVMIFPKRSINPLYGSESYAYYGRNSNELLVAEPQLEYKYQQGKQHYQFFTGATWQVHQREGSFITGKNYSNEQLLEYAGAAGTVTASNQYSEYKYASVFGRIKYDYAERYLLQLQARRDASSKFGPGRNAGNFWSAAAAWNFSKEAFLKDNPVISYGKLRASYGTNGNDQIQDYQYLSTYRASSSVYQGVTSLSPSRIANSLFGWESSRKFETGLETGFYNNRILFTASYYIQRSSNQLVEYPLPYMSGPFGYYIANLPAVIENKGWEFDGDAQLLKSKQLKWSVQANLSLPQNKLVRYPGLASSSYAYTYAVGEDINVRRGLHYLGADEQTGLPLYEDINKDGQISLPEDYIIMGKTSPVYYGGAGTDLSWKGFELSVFFQFTKQMGTSSVSSAGSMNNQYADVLLRWQKAGDVTTVPRASVNQPTGYSYLLLSDAAFRKAGYVRLKNVSLSYRLPMNVLEKLHLQTVRFYAEGQNLFTWYRMKNIPDPETGYNGIGVLRTIVAGISITL